MGQDVWRWFKRSVLYGSLVLGSLFIVLASLMALQLPNDKIWASERPDWLTLLFVAAAIGSAQLPWEVVYLRTLLIERRTRLRLTEYARLMFIEAMERSPSICLTLSVHVWRTKRNYRPWTIRMERITTFRLAERPMSDVTWVEGKGVLGKAWAERRGLVADLRRLRATVAEGGRPAFQALSPAERFNLNWDDFQRTRDYTAIYACPLMSQKGKVIGSVTVDSTASNAHDQLHRMLGNVQVRENVRAMSRAVENGDAV